MIGTVHAQEALFSNLSVDNTLAAAAEATVGTIPDRSHLGPVDFTLGISAEVRFDDNITLLQSNALDDVIVGAGLNLGFFWPVTDTSTLRLQGGLGYDDYLQHSIYDALEVTPDSALSWELSFEDGGVTVYDQCSYTREVITEGAVAGVGRLPRFENLVGIRGRWLPEHWRLELDCSHADYLSESESYLDRSSEYVFARAGWRFGRETQAGLEGSTAWTDYRLDSQPDNTSYSAGLFVECKISPFLEVTARGGPTFYAFDSGTPTAGDNQLGSYYASLKVNHQPTDFIRHYLGVNRDVRLGLNQGSKYIEQLTANYGISWSVTRYASLALDLTYEHGSQPLIQFTSQFTEEFDRFGLSPALAYRLADKFSVRLSYQHWSRFSNLDGRSYDENSVAAGANFTF